MKKLIGIFVIALSAIGMGGCTRIETGEVGVRVDWNKQIQPVELSEGTWNQTIVGDVLTFPVRDIPIQLDNKQPITKDNTALADFDMTIVYNLNKSAVADLYINKSKAFHLYDEKHKDTYLMYNYISTMASNAAYKAVREYSTLEVADNRLNIERKIVEYINTQMVSEKLNEYIHISAVQVRSVLPNAAVLEAATNLVRSENDIKVKRNDILLAELEAKRMIMLSSNSANSIAYMDAQARVNFSNAALLGKVNTIIVPADFKGMLNVGK